MSYSLSIEFVYIRNYAEPFSYRSRRRATLAELHSSCALTRDTADRVMVPSSSSRPGEVARCMAVAGLGQRYTSSTERPSAARCQSCSQPILLVQRRRRTLDRIEGPLCTALQWTQRTGQVPGTHYRTCPVCPSRWQGRADTARTRNRAPQLPKLTLHSP